MLEETKPDIVVIASPPNLHREIALRAFEQGAHVLCEKPLAMTAAEGRDMAEAARRAQRVAMTSFNWRFIPAMQRFHSLVEEGGVGRLFHAAGRWLGARWADEAAPSTWRMDRAQAGHGAMGDMGVHADRPHTLALRRVRTGDRAGRRGLSDPQRSRRQADRRGGLLQRDGRAGFRRAGDVLGEPRRRGANESFLEAYGSQGSLVYRLDREKPKWYVGELRAAGASGTLQPVPITAGLPRSAGEGDQMEVDRESHDSRRW